MAWEKLTPLTEPVQSGCLNCGTKPIVMPLDRLLAVGFGSVTVSKGIEISWTGDCAFEEEELTLADFEKKAIADPDHDWRVAFHTPLWDGTWQRQGEGEWLLVKKGPGFA